MHVVVSESLGEAAFRRLRERHRVTEGAALHRDPAALRDALRDADALIVRNGTLVDAALLEAAPRLRVVGRLGVGLDNIDVEACRRRGVRLVVPRGANAAAVAEYVMAALLHFARPLLAADADVRAGGWQRERFRGRELYGKRLGLVGLGETGLRVARRALAFGMEVVAWAPHTAPSSFAGSETGVRLVALDELLETSDAVSLHVPLTNETRGLLGRAEIARMKRGVVLVNAARGGLVDEDALYEALAGGRLRGAALDVRALEPPEESDRLAQLPNVLLTPHLAGHTQESLERVADEVVRSVLREAGET